jgi:Transposase DDE domain group 1
MNVNVMGKASGFNVCFEEVTLSNHAGIVLLRELADRLGVAELLDAELHVKERKRGYCESDSILSLCWNLILGGDCLSDLNVLRGDPGTRQLLGVETILAPTTAGEFLRKFDLGNLTRLRNLLAELATRVRPWQQSDVVTLDMDSSLYEQCSTRKEGSRKGYDGTIGYAPLFCFWAEEQELLMTHLLAGNRNPAKKLEWFWQQVWRVVPAGRRVKMRGDSGFYHWCFIRALEKHDITYAITADQTEQLLQQITALPEKAWKSFGHGTQAQYAEFQYAPNREASHRYVVKRERRQPKKKAAYWHYYVVVTNELKSTARQVLHWALKRCGVENFIKEHKSGFGLEKLPTQKFHANWTWLLIGQLAYNLVSWCKRLILPEQYEKATLKTIRHQLLNVAGKIVTSARQFFLVLSDESFYQSAWAFALNRLADMKSG